MAQVHPPSSGSLNAKELAAEAIRNFADGLDWFEVAELEEMDAAKKRSDAVDMDRPRDWFYEDPRTT